MNKSNQQFEAVFISDLHLGNGFVDIPLLKQFLEAIKGKTEALYLVGDIFDSWRHCKPADFIDLFSGFQKIVYIKGNHDGPFAEDQNPLPTPAIVSEKLCWNGKTGVVTHAHLFDPHFSGKTLWATFMDALIYKTSRLIHYDLKESLGKIAVDYSTEIEEKSSISGEVFCSDFMIIGHTHVGGDRTDNGVRIFNLGSWLTEPFAFFKNKETYAFKKIEGTSLLPAEAEFKKIL